MHSLKLWKHRWKNAWLSHSYVILINVTLIKKKGFKYSWRRNNRFRKWEFRLFLKSINYENNYKRAQWLYQELIHLRQASFVIITTDSFNTVSFNYTSVVIWFKSMNLFLDWFINQRSSMFSIKLLSKHSRVYFFGSLVNYEVFSIFFMYKII